MPDAQLKQRILEREKINPVVVVQHGGKEVKYSTTNLNTLWRVETLHTKEPDTIEWISLFDENDVMLDVGANVGMYTVWAAVTRGCRVYAFEPESQNYAQLNVNLHLNRLADRVQAYCVALSDTTEFSVLNLGEFLLGGSNHSFKDEVNFKLEALRTAYKQGCFATTLDALVEQGAVPVPQHIKIDVDGIEHRVIAGMHKTLQNPAVKTLLVEINTNLPEHQAIIQKMSEYGFSFSQEDIARSVGRQDDTAFAGVGNYIFFRLRKDD